MHKYLATHKIIIAFTAKTKSYQVCVNFNGLLSLINMCICDVLLNFFVSVYVYVTYTNNLLSVVVAELHTKQKIAGSGTGG